MKQLFERSTSFTDFHLGLKGNSQTHLKDCEEYIDWYIEESAKLNADTGFFLGDWSHNRNSINLSTLEVSVRCLEKLGKAFKQFFWFPGNHDLYYKDKRTVHSSLFGKHIPGITVINETTTIDGVTLVPWLVGNEWKKLSSIKSKYMFGHFELPLFYMNAMVQMPDHGELQASHFTHQDYVFSGHFHKRQQKDKIVYIGNAFPHNFADAWDDDRGFMFLEWDKKPQFHNWGNCPKYRTITLSKLLTNVEYYLKNQNKLHLKVYIDVDISYEEANYLRDTFSQTYDIREFSLIQERLSVDNTGTEVASIEFETVDKIVTNELKSIQSDSIDTNVLLNIYNNL